MQLYLHSRGVKPVKLMFLPAVSLEVGGKRGSVYPFPLYQLAPWVSPLHDRRKYANVTVLTYKHNVA